MDNSERTCIPCGWFFPRCSLLDSFSGLFYFAIKENNLALSSGLFIYYVYGTTAHERQESFFPSKTRKHIEDMENDCVINCGVLNSY